MSHDGGSAFPETFTDPRGKDGTYSAGGMTLRDYFAAKAMQAQITARAGSEAPIAYAVQSSVATLVTVAYAYADEMLKARST